MLYHERIILAVSVARPGEYAVLTPDGDRYAESFLPDDPDVAEVLATNGLGDEPPGLQGEPVHRFRAIPTRLALVAHYRDAALMLGVPINGAINYAGTPIWALPMPYIFISICRFFMDRQSPNNPQVTWRTHFHTVRATTSSLLLNLWGCEIAY